jgi:hypothetical protein
MSASLADLRARLAQTLMDSGYAIWASADLDEALRQALHDLSNASPNRRQATLTLTEATREITLDSLAGLLEVLAVHWPYDESAGTWPPNRVRGWRLIRLDGAPVLQLTVYEAPQPQAGEKLRLGYTTLHTLNGLDGETLTSLSPELETLLVTGAAGKAAQHRSADLMETDNVDLYAVGLLANWGKLKLKEFHYHLDQLRRSQSRQGVPWESGWRLDEWDLRT